MASVVHFSHGNTDAVCGARVFLCEDYSDDPQYVSCLRCRKTKAFINYDPTRYDVDVWNHEGDVIRHLRDATASEVEAIREEYEDEPVDVVVTER